MKINFFECPECRERTKHMEVTFREFLALRDGGSQLSAYLLCDATGMTKFWNGVLGRNFWKCCKCGRPTCRNMKGDEV